MEKIAVVAPMQSASVTRVVAVMPLDFHSRRKACRKSVREPVHRLDVEAEAFGDDIIIEDVELRKRLTTDGNAIRWFLRIKPYRVVSLWEQEGLARKVERKSFCRLRNHLLEQEGCLREARAGWS